MKELRTIGIIAVLGGIAWYVAYQIKLSYKLIYGYKNFKLKSVNSGVATIGFDFTIENTTELDINIRGVDIDILANDVFLTTIYSNIEVIVRPNTTASLPITATINPKHLFQNAGIILFGAGAMKDMKLTMKGKIKVRKYGIPIMIPFKYNSKLEDWY